MSFNTFGDYFRLTTFGESHGLAVGGIIDGCPSNIKINFDKINKFINRRKTNKSKIVSSRNEEDKVIFLSGIYKKYTLGTPIGFIIINKDTKSKDYKNIKNIFRPSHADYTYYKKYKIRDYRGGGRSSARETICRVVAGAIVKQILKKKIKVYAYVSSIGKIKLKKKYYQIKKKNINKSIIKCPNKKTTKKMLKYILKIKNNKDTIGGIITCIIKKLPIGLGDPLYKKFSSELSNAMFTINAVKGFEYGNGFKSTKLLGSQNNDIFLKNYKTKTNNSGGIQGGITNGMDIYFNVAFKPISSILKPQNTRNIYNKKTKILIKGRHDVCILPRVIPIVESMTYLVIINKIISNKIFNIFK
ncbi:MAG: chorismate synthase [Candidatus Shikimatogenerans sp. Tser]|uniref:Chorismate synthase n=1 Tax=Candidatus Shikimatogenerans sp. Tser TaxID=3158568 RepID=A0AAU7QRA6_9FLAO